MLLSRVIRFESKMQNSADGCRGACRGISEEKYHADFQRKIQGWGMDIHHPSISQPSPIPLYRGMSKLQI